MIKICERYEYLKNQWISSFDNSMSSLSDPLSDEGRRKLFFSVYDKEVDRMNGTLRKHKQVIPQEEVKATKSSKTSEYYKKVALEVDLARMHDPPGIAYFPFLSNYTVNLIIH